MISDWIWIVCEIARKKKEYPAIKIVIDLQSCRQIVGLLQGHCHIRVLGCKGAPIIVNPHNRLRPHNAIIRPSPILGEFGDVRSENVTNASGFTYHRCNSFQQTPISVFYLLAASSIFINTIWLPVGIRQTSTAAKFRCPSQRSS